MTRIEKYYWEKVSTQGAMLFTLIDPDKCFLENAAKLAKTSVEAGSDAILVGGSIGAQGSVLDETVQKIKEVVDIPVVLFPGNISGLSQFADAVYFMYMLNSRDVYWLSTAQIQAAPVVQKMKIEAIPTSYVVLEPGKAVGWIGNANLVPRDRPDLAYACALASRFMGCRVLISDSGSGAEEPAPVELISAMARACGDEVFYVYGGGIKNGDQAADIIEAGARGIQIGTAFETGNVSDKIKRIKASILEAGKKKV
ncbi:geranylgeranylglyceryl/heptaprenylglyceryl phosphate synthase [Candidatus Micrarchaeota archaeon]|nr:geranylgeranylglyceryl/heptaprenylglyceryl phosphate synthase [Candidatus Micrarchaeota archaeon]